MDVFPECCHWRLALGFCETDLLVVRTICTDIFLSLSLVALSPYLLQTTSMFAFGYALNINESFC